MIIDVHSMSFRINETKRYKEQVQLAVRSAVAQLVLQLLALHQVLKQLWLLGHKDRQLDFASQNVTEISDLYMHIFTFYTYV